MTPTEAALLTAARNYAAATRKRLDALHRGDYAAASVLQSDSQHYCQKMCAIARALERKN